MSSFYSPKYSRTNFMKQVEVEVGKGKSVTKITLVDRLDDNYIDFINNTQADSIYIVKSGDNLPNISWLKYQNTTLWWVIARANGIIDPLSIKAGDRLLIPSFNSINTNVSVADTGNIGSTVVI